MLSSNFSLMFVNSFGFYATPIVQSIFLWVGELRISFRPGEKLVAQGDIFRYFEDCVGGFVAFFSTYTFSSCLFYNCYIRGNLAFYFSCYFVSLSDSGKSMFMARFLLQIFVLNNPKTLSGDEVFFLWAGDDGCCTPVLIIFFDSFSLTSSLIGFYSITANSFFIYFYNTILLPSLAMFYFFCVRDMFILL